MTISVSIKLFVTLVNIAKQMHTLDATVAIRTILNLSGHSLSLIEAGRIQRELAQLPADFRTNENIPGLHFGDFASVSRGLTEVDILL